MRATHNVPRKRASFCGVPRSARDDSARDTMKFSVNWLREFVDLPENPEEIADLLTRAGVETENIETRGGKIEQVIVSQIVASSRHPNADRLSVCEVDDGSGTKKQIVCRANCRSFPERHHSRCRNHTEPWRFAESLRIGARNCGARRKKT